MLNARKGKDESIIITLILFVSDLSIVISITILNLSLFPAIRLDLEVGWMDRWLILPILMYFNHYTL